MTTKALEVLDAVRLVNTFIQLAPGVLPLIQDALESDKPTVSMVDVEAAADEAGVDLDALHTAIAERRKRDAAAKS